MGLTDGDSETYVLCSFSIKGQTGEEEMRRWQRDIEKDPACRPSGGPVNGKGPLFAFTEKRQKIKAD
jgi:hypothetical protein